MLDWERIVQWLRTSCVGGRIGVQLPRSHVNAGWAGQATWTCSDGVLSKNSHSHELWVHWETLPQRIKWGVVEELFCQPQPPDACAERSTHKPISPTRDLPIVTNMIFVIWNKNTFKFTAST